MSGSRRIGVVAAVCAAVLAFAAPAHATGPLDKLGRGLGNTFTGWLEIPAQVAETTEAKGSIAGIFVGLVKGIAYGVGRTAVGLFEAVTFPLPSHMNKPGDLRAEAYDPIIYPEFVEFRRGDKL